MGSPLPKELDNRVQEELMSFFRSRWDDLKRSQKKSVPLRTRKNNRLPWHGVDFLLEDGCPSAIVIYTFIPPDKDLPDDWIGSDQLVAFFLTSPRSVQMRRPSKFWALCIPTTEQNWEAIIGGNFELLWRLRPDGGTSVTIS